jgi:hypothetical protein
VTVIPTVPAKERWQTTSGGYGNFYVSVHKEVFTIPFFISSSVLKGHPKSVKHE